MASSQAGQLPGRLQTRAWVGGSDLGASRLPATAPEEL